MSSRSSSRTDAPPWLNVTGTSTWLFTIRTRVTCSPWSAAVTAAATRVSWRWREEAATHESCAWVDAGGAPWTPGTAVAAVAADDAIFGAGVEPGQTMYTINAATTHEAIMRGSIGIFENTLTRCEMLNSSWA